MIKNKFLNFVLAALLLGMIGTVSAQSGDYTQGSSATTEVDGSYVQDKNGDMGMEIQPNKDLAGIDVKIHSASCTGNLLYLMDADGNVLDSKTVNDLSLDHRLTATLNKDNYYAVLYETGSTTCDSADGGSTNFPVTSSDIDIITGIGTDQGTVRSNWGNPSWSFNIKTVTALFDSNSAPSIDSHSTSPSNWTVGQSADFSYDVSDSDGTVETVRLEVFDEAGNLEKGQNFSYSSSNVVDTQTDWFSPQVADNYTVYFTAYDNQGASTVQTLSKTAQLGDTTAPDITIHNPFSSSVDNAYTVNNPPLDVTANETVSTWEYEILATGFVKETFTPNTTLLVQDGTYTINVSATDGAGNTGSETSQFTVDSTEPNFDYTNVIPNQPLINSYVSYNTSTTDTTANVDENCLSVDYGSTTVYSKNCKTTNPTEWNNIYNITTGNKWLNATFETTDTNGNTNTTKLNRFVEDSRPSFQINDPDSIEYEGKDIPYAVDFNDDGDDNPNENAYCEAYNDGNLVRNESVSESVAGTFSGTISGVEYGSHIFWVECEELEGSTLTLKNKSVSYTNSEPNPTFNKETPNDGEIFTYLDGKKETPIWFNGSFNAEFSGVYKLAVDQGLDQNYVYTDTFNSGTTEYSILYDVNTSSDNHEYFITLDSDDTSNGYQSVIRSFTTSAFANPAPVVNQTNYDAQVQQKEPVEFDFLTSDYTEKLGNYSINIYNRFGNKVSTISGSLDNTSQWVNDTSLFKASTPGNYTINLKVSDNFGFTTTNNYTVETSEGSPSFNLIEPKERYGTDGEKDTTVEFTYDISLPSKGNVTILYSTPNSSGFVQDGSEFLNAFSFTNRKIKSNFTDISYTRVAGEDYSVSDQYSWKIRYTSNYSNTSYESSIQTWRFSTETRDETVEEQSIFDRYFVGILAGSFFLAIALLVLIKYEIRGRIFPK